MIQFMGGDMSLLEIVVIFTTYVVILVFFGICIIRLIQTNDRFVRFIMAQKDINAFTYSFDGKKESKMKIDVKKEKEAQDYNDYMKLVNSGICDEKDVQRFGTISVDQG